MPAAAWILIDHRYLCAGGLTRPGSADGRFDGRSEHHGRGRRRRWRGSLRRSRGRLFSAARHGRKGNNTEQCADGNDPFEHVPSSQPVRANDGVPAACGSLVNRFTYVNIPPKNKSIVSGLECHNRKNICTLRGPCQYLLGAGFSQLKYVTREGGLHRASPGEGRNDRASGLDTFVRLC